MCVTVMAISQRLLFDGIGLDFPLEGRRTKELVEANGFPQDKCVCRTCQWKKYLEEPLGKTLEVINALKAKNYRCG